MSFLAKGQILFFFYTTSLHFEFFSNIFWHSNSLQKHKFITLISNSLTIEICNKFANKRSKLPIAWKISDCNHRIYVARERATS